MTAEELKDGVTYLKSALAGAAATTGSEFLPDETAEEIIGLVYERSFARQAFPSVSMTRDTLKMPKVTGSVTFSGHALTDAEAGTAGAESRNTTGEVTLEMKTLIANIPIGNRLVAYGVQGIMPAIRDDIAARLAFNEEEMILNGDLTITSSYADNINGAYDSSNNAGGVSATVNTHLLQFDGLRSLATGTAVDAGGDALASADIRSAIANLGVYAQNRDELLLIVPRSVEADMLGWTELQTVDKYGPQATILTGEIGKVYGISVVATSALPDSVLTSAGVNPGDASGTLSVCLLVHTRSPVIGNPSMSARRFTIGFEDEPKSDRFVLIPRQDLAFTVRYSDAIVLIRNVL